MWILPYTTKEDVWNLLRTNNLLTTKVELALNQAIKSHTGQKRDDGQPYLEEHIFPIVASVLKKYKEDSFIEELLLICILHDVIEDDQDASVEELTNIFGKKIISHVLYLTKSPAENAHGLPQEEKAKINKAVLDRLKSAPKLVQIAKLEDRLNNITCVEQINKPKFVRYTQETIDSYVPFAKHVHQPIYVDLLEEQVRRLTQTS